MMLIEDWKYLSIILALPAGFLTPPFFNRHYPRLVLSWPIDTKCIFCIAIRKQKHMFIRAVALDEKFYAVILCNAGFLAVISNSAGTPVFEKHHRPCLWTYSFLLSGRTLLVDFVEI